jgi:hypothetical protein
MLAGLVCCIVVTKTGGALGKQWLQCCEACRPFRQVSVLSLLCLLTRLLLRHTAEARPSEITPPNNVDKLGSRYSPALSMNWKLPLANLSSTGQSMLSMRRWQEVQSRERAVWTACAEPLCEDLLRRTISSIFNASPRALVSFLPQDAAARDGQMHKWQKHCSPGSVCSGRRGWAQPPW